MRFGNTDKEVPVNSDALWGCGAFLMVGALITVLLLMTLLCGCGHNTITYSDGITLETTINPETWTIGVGLRYGKILTACVRENTELEIAGSGSGGASKDSASTKASSDTEIKFKVGKQITGYYVDAIKAKADPDKYLDSNKSDKEDKK